MDKQVYVYWAEGKAEDLKGYVDSYLGSPVCFWAGDIATIQLGQALPTDWLAQGAVFNERGELRWWKGCSGYQALLISEQPVSGLDPLEGEWRGDAKTETVFLQDLAEPRVKPLFSEYPTRMQSGWLRVRVCRRNGVIVCISPRAYVASAEEA